MSMNEPSLTHTRQMKTDTYQLLQLYRGLENSRLAANMCRACSADLQRALQLVREHIEAALENASLSAEAIRRRGHFMSKLEEVERHVARSCEHRHPIPRGVIPQLLKLHTQFFRALIEEQVRARFENELVSAVRVGKLVIADCG